jgi:hypothetical protein
MDKYGVIDPAHTPVPEEVKQASQEDPQLLADHPATRLAQKVKEQLAQPPAEPPNAAG